MKEEEEKKKVQKKAATSSSPPAAFSVTASVAAFTVKHQHKNVDRDGVDNFQFESYDYEFKNV